MGMTIEEAIKYYENKNVVLTEEEAEANTIALYTMRKYQKIQEIINNTEYIEEDVIRYKMICGVIEDGKID